MSGTGSETEMEHSEMEEEVPQAAPSKKGKKRVGRKSAGGGKKVAKTPTKGARSSARKVKTATPNARTAPAPKKSKSKSQGRPKSGGKQKKEEKDYEVEKIVGVKRETNRKEFLVKWKGYSGATWEPEANVVGCKYLIQNFVNSLKN